MPRKLGTPDVIFTLQVKKGRERQDCPVLAVMQANSIRYYISPGDGCKPSEFDRATGRAKLSKASDPARRDELEQFNKSLDWWEATMKQVWRDCHKAEIGQPIPPQVSRERFKELVYCKAGFSNAQQDMKQTLLEFAADYLERRAKEKGEQHPTVKSLRYGVKQLRGYASRHGKPSFDSINFEWSEKFKAWLFSPAMIEGEKRNALGQNTAQQVISAIQRIVNDARKKGLTNNTLVMERGFTVKKAPTNKTSFMLDELEAIVKVDLSKHPKRKELERVRLLTIIGVGTGLRFSDLHKVSRELVETHDGEEMINVFAQKTKKPIGIPLLPVMKTMLDANDWKVPKISIQRYNEFIKELCKAAGLNREVLILSSTGGKMSSKKVPFHEVVSSHACRRTFISTMLLLGVPASQLLPITGHATEIQMRNYAAIENRQNAAHLSKAFRERIVDFLGIGAAKNVAKSTKNA